MTSQRRFTSSPTELKERILREAERLNYGKIDRLSTGKPHLRRAHRAAQIDRLARERTFIRERGLGLLHHFADGTELQPERIDPRLVEVQPKSEESDLFRLASLLWSVPASRGFGRRVRFLVRDNSNGKLIGLFGLCDPVFNLKVRDDWIGWSASDRKVYLRHVLDGFIIGAVPPYSQLIAGKLVAALLGSSEVLATFSRKYGGNRRAVIMDRPSSGRVALVTTSSALGRSSIYNRLKIPNGPKFLRLGFTEGFGHFHLSAHLFELFRQYLLAIGHPYARGNRFGMGPNWRLRVARAALDRIGLDSRQFLHHGISREVHAVPLALNLSEGLQGAAPLAYSRLLPASSISEYCLERWILPRATRDITYQAHRRQDLRRWLTRERIPQTWARRRRRQPSYGRSIRRDIRRPTSEK